MMALTPKKRLFVTAMILLVSGTAQRVAGQDYTVDEASARYPVLLQMEVQAGRGR